MKKFMIAYHGGVNPSSKEEGVAQMEKWKTWISSLGDAIVNPGTPLINSKIITEASVEADLDENFMKGFAIIQATDLDAAISLAKSDPFLDTQGTIRISEMMEMN